MIGTAQVSPGMAQAILRAGSEQIRRKAELAGVSTTVALEGAVGTIPRRGSASKPHSTPGSVHNVRFRHRLYGTELPMILMITAEGGSYDLDKMWLLNYGRSGGVRITPVRATRLKFHWDKVGKTVYAKAVTQGGFAGRFFIEAGIAAGMPWPVQRIRRG